MGIIGDRICGLEDRSVKFTNMNNRASRTSGTISKDTKLVSLESQKDRRKRVG